MLTIKLQPGQNIWFTSDYHIQHKNICRGTSSWTSGYRDFDTLQAMEDTIVSNHNSVVKPQDYVFNLGDVIFGDKMYLPTFLAKLNCQNIYLCRGNHDDYLKTERCKDFNNLFKGVFDYLELVIDYSGCGNQHYRIHRKQPVKQLYILSHYPFKTWRDAAKKSIHLYGHEHGNLPDDINRFSIDVGVDTQIHHHKKFFPYSDSEIDSIMLNYKQDWLKVGHHKE